MTIFLNGLRNKSVTVEGAVIHIEKDGLFNIHEKTILIQNINAVVVKRPGSFNGYIKFCLPGDRHLDTSFSMTDGVWDAATDENSVLFKDDYHYKIALQIKDYIENYADNQKPSSVNRAEVKKPFLEDYKEELKKLKELFDNDLISEEEYTQKKRQILGLNK